MSDQTSLSGATIRSLPRSTQRHQVILVSAPEFQRAAIHLVDPFIGEREPLCERVDFTANLHTGL